MAQGIGGGTRIGESLRRLHRFHAKRMIHARTAVLIVSDGYDTGTPERLAAEMKQLRRRCRRIVWLNPLIGWKDYTPEARGMKAALPYIDSGSRRATISKAWPRSNPISRGSDSWDTRRIFSRWSPP